MSDQIVIDQYSPLSHKPLVGQPGSRGLLRTVPSWVPASERRRLNAYITRQSYPSNVARLLLPPPARLLTNTTLPEDPRSEHREYGDASLLVDRIKAGVLGSEWELVVDGADEDLPDEPDIPPVPEPLDDGVNPVIARIHNTRMARWQESATAIVDQWEADWQAQPELQARQEELREWADRVQFDARINQSERADITLGDSVIALMPRVGDWPRLRVYDPGVYFPVLDDDMIEDFPTRVHLAWEFDRTVNGETKRFVRRTTYELVDLTSTKIMPTDVAGVPEWQGQDGRPATTPMLAPNEGVDPDGRVWRMYPWETDPDRRSFRTCLYSNGVWPLDRIEAGDVDALDESKGTFSARRVDMQCDFLPLVHVPNSPEGEEHYGRGSFDDVVQLMDDIAQTDTDTMSAARLTAVPALGLSNAHADAETQVRPGTIFNMGEHGRMDVLDLSNGVKVLMEFVQHLQDRFWTNSRIPQKMVGRTQGNEQASGLAIGLEFAPFAQLVGVLRMTRLPKYSLLLGFAQRLAMLQGVIEPGVLPRARLQFGSFLPTNKRENVEIVARALDAHAMSTQQAVAFLVAGGFPVDDARAEVDRIHQEDTEAAVHIGDATTSNELAADWLGMEIPEDETAPPVIGLPPVPPVGGQPPP